jgi:hypothetical protein
MNVFLDIETIPAQPEEATKEEIRSSIQAPATMKKAETIQEWHEGKGKYAGVKDEAVEKAYRDTSFNGAKGQVCSIAWIANGVLDSVSTEGKSEEDILRYFFGSISKSGRDRPPFFIGHYVAGFDLKFLFHRAIILGVNFSAIANFKLPFDGRHGKDYYCTQAAWAGFNGKISQNNLCKALGIEGKPGDIDGSKVWDFVKAGDIKRVEEYNRHDVETVEKIYNRLNFR